MATGGFDLEKPLPYIGFSVMQIIWFFVVLIVGFIVVKIVIWALKKSFKRTPLPEILAEFLVRVTAIVLYILVFLLAVTALGYDMNAIVLGLSAILGLMLGFGLQDTITNMASGFWIALTRPFDKNDVVSVQGFTGSVKHIGIMSTTMLAPDNTVITIPNKSVWGSPMVNYTKMDIRRVDVNVGVAYGTDLDKAVKIAMDIMKNHELVLKNPEPSVAITELADSSINLQLRPWAKTENYWTVKGEITKAIYEAYGKEGIEIPFPQVDVHLKKE
ncbi:small-conductance mechanosensitive channel [Aciduliprofundum sp. MAR08-339]|uniref:mechanosensitive ion channel family protein n=1 Tax=Aciduliprofundum sp. (strain MAR08-339) TaxID=673860 RepID=UPI0002A4A735|nr:small-conductance mechanosensitive channel [Aciduliprofundum sp. MAR08-339]